MVGLGFQHWVDSTLCFLIILLIMNNPLNRIRGVIQVYNIFNTEHDKYIINSDTFNSKSQLVYLIGDSDVVDI